ncbi:MAG: ATP-binding cassette domain-containing protein [Chloroflexi bacterium]|nr:ATP-binding cassette domain-containing protein [Chloroflexota bacterium]
MSINAQFSRRFGNFNLDVKLQAEDERLALFGASGSGKSLTLKCIAGIFKPDKGYIQVNGQTLFDSKKNINLSPQERRTGYLFQNYALFPNMTVEQNIRCGLKRHSSTKNQKIKTAELIETFFLKGVEHQHPGQLSGGQQQRTALARIFASKPEIILLDEPLSALDSFLRWQLEQELMTALNSFPGTTILVSHNDHEVRRICDQVIVIDHGRTESPKKVSNFFKNPETFSSAILIGFRNFSRLRHINEKQVLAIDWNCVLTLENPLAKGIRYVSIRESDFSLLPQQSCSFVCKVLKRVEDLHTTLFTLEPIHTDSQSPFNQVLFETDHFSAANVNVGDEINIYFSQENIHFLT